ncbi:MAG: hypothetical protein ING19_21155 [Azospirillum sp.]|nr:hypothetical protein [Azospirillum sp.]MCA3268561.1 hypothetical protein [Azospirillum sp.]
MTTELTDEELLRDLENVIPAEYPATASSRMLIAKSRIEFWKARAERAEAEVARLRAAAKALANAADDVGVSHFDTDSLSPEVRSMQSATLALRAALAGAKEKRDA